MPGLTPHLSCCSSYRGCCCAPKDSATAPIAYATPAVARPVKNMRLRPRLTLYQAPSDGSLLPELDSDCVSSWCHVFPAPLKTSSCLRTLGLLGGAGGAGAGFEGNSSRTVAASFCIRTSGCFAIVAI